MSALPSSRGPGTVDTCSAPLNVPQPAHTETVAA